jgi:hypothetical protein
MAIEGSGFYYATAIFMFKNYVKVALRGLWKNKFSSIINILGLLSVFNPPRRHLPRGGNFEV